MILVTTAGKVGAEAARLLAQQAPVRVLVRDRGKAAALTRSGVDVVEGDLAVPASIDAAMEGVSAVVLVSPAVPAQELDVVRSAASAGVRHVVKITSKASADSPIARRRDQHQIETGLIASGLAYTLLRNNAYTQNFLMLAPDIAKADSFASSTGEGRIGMVDTRDVAAVAAKIALAPTAHVGKTYWPAGPDRLSYSGAADVLSRLLRRPIAFRPLSFDEQKQAMIDAGLPVAVPCARRTPRHSACSQRATRTGPPTTSPRSSAGRLAPSRSSSPTTPHPSRELLAVTVCAARWRTPPRMPRSPPDLNAVGRSGGGRAVGVAAAPGAAFSAHPGRDPCPRCRVEAARGRAPGWRA